VSNGPTIAGSYEDFKRLTKDFFDALPTATDPEQIEAGMKCVGLAYLGIQWDDTSPMDNIHRLVGAPAVLRLVTKLGIIRQVELEGHSGVPDLV